RKDGQSEEEANAVDEAAVRRNGGRGRREEEKDDEQQREGRFGRAKRVSGGSKVGLFSGEKGSAYQAEPNLEQRRTMVPRPICGRRTGAQIASRANQHIWV